MPNLFEKLIFLLVFTVAVLFCAGYLCGVYVHPHLFPRHDFPFDKGQLDDSFFEKYSTCPILQNEEALLFVRSSLLEDGDESVFALLQSVCRNYQSKDTPAQKEFKEEGRDKANVDNAPAEDEVHGEAKNGTSSAGVAAERFQSIILGTLVAIGILLVSVACLFLLRFAWAVFGWLMLFVSTLLLHPALFYLAYRLLHTPSSLLFPGICCIASIGLIPVTCFTFAISINVLPRPGLRNFGAEDHVLKKVRVLTLFVVVVASVINFALLPLDMILAPVILGTWMLIAQINPYPFNKQQIDSLCGISLVSLGILMSKYLPVLNWLKEIFASRLLEVTGLDVVLNSYTRYGAWVFCLGLMVYFVGFRLFRENLGLSGLIGIALSVALINLPDEVQLGTNPVLPMIAIWSVSVPALLAPFYGMYWRRTLEDANINHEQFTFRRQTVPFMNRIGFGLVIVSGMMLTFVGILLWDNGFFFLSSCFSVWVFYFVSFIGDNRLIPHIRRTQPHLEFRINMEVRLLQIALGFALFVVIPSGLNIVCLFAAFGMLFTVVRKRYFFAGAIAADTNCNMITTAAMLVFTIWFVSHQHVEVLDRLFPIPEMTGVLPFRSMGLAAIRNHHNGVLRTSSYPFSFPSKHWIPSLLKVIFPENLSNWFVSWSWPFVFILFWAMFSPLSMIIYGEGLHGRRRQTTITKYVYLGSVGLSFVIFLVPWTPLSASMSSLLYFVVPLGIISPLPLAAFAKAQINNANQQHGGRQQPSQVPELTEEQRQDPDLVARHRRSVMENRIMQGSGPFILVLLATFSSVVSAALADLYWHHSSIIIHVSLSDWLWIILYSVFSVLLWALSFRTFLVFPSFSRIATMVFSDQYGGSLAFHGSGFLGAICCSTVLFYFTGLPLLLFVLTFCLGGVLQIVTMSWQTLSRDTKNVTHLCFSLILLGISMKFHRWGTSSSSTSGFFHKVSAESPGFLGDYASNLFAVALPSLYLSMYERLMMVWRSYIALLILHAIPVASMLFGVILERKFLLLLSLAGLTMSYGHPRRIGIVHRVGDVGNNGLRSAQRKWAVVNVVPGAIALILSNTIDPETSLLSFCFVWIIGLYMVVYAIGYWAKAFNSDKRMSTLLQRTILSILGGLSIISMFLDQDHNIHNALPKPGVSIFLSSITVSRLIRFCLGGVSMLCVFLSHWPISSSTLYEFDVMRDGWKFFSPFYRSKVCWRVFVHLFEVVAFCVIGRFSDSSCHILPLINISIVIGSVLYEIRFLWSYLTERDAHKRMLLNTLELEPGTIEDFMIPIRFGLEDLALGTQEQRTIVCENVNNQLTALIDNPDENLIHSWDVTTIVRNELNRMVFYSPETIRIVSSIISLLSLVLRVFFLPKDASALSLSASWALDLTSFSIFYVMTARTRPGVLITLAMFSLVPAISIHNWIFIIASVLLIAYGLLRWSVCYARDVLGGVAFVILPFILLLVGVLLLYLGQNIENVILFWERISVVISSLIVPLYKQAWYSSNTVEMLRSIPARAALKLSVVKFNYVVGILVFTYCVVMYRVWNEIERQRLGNRGRRNIRNL